MDGSSLIAWILLAGGLAVAAAIAGKPTDDDLTLPGSDSTRATDLLDQKLPDRANGTVPIALRARNGKLDEGADKAAVKQVVKAYRASPDVRDAVSPFSEAGADNLSKDRTIGYIALNLGPGPGDLDEDQANALIALADPAKQAGIEVAAGGYLGQEVSRPATESSEGIGLAVAVVVLLFAFGTLVAMPLPIISAIFGLVGGLSLIGLLGHLISIPTIAATLGTMLGLGVGIDYALFIITRHRGFLEQGHDVEESVATGDRDLRRCGPVRREHGRHRAALAVLRRHPDRALARLLRRDRRRRRRPHRDHPAARDPRPARAAHQPPEAAVRQPPPRRPAPWLGAMGPRRRQAAVAGGDRRPADPVGPGDSRCSTSRSASPTTGSSPRTRRRRRSYDILTEGFGAGTNGPLLVSVKLDPPAKPDTKKLDQVEAKQQRQQQKAQQQYEQQVAAAQEAAQEAAATGAPPPPPPQPPAGPLQAAAGASSTSRRPSSSHRSAIRGSSKLGNQIGKQSDVDDVSLPALNKQDTAAVLNVTSQSAPTSQRTVDLVNNLRDDAIPSALGKGTRRRRTSAARPPPTSIWRTGSRRSCRS